MRRLRVSDVGVLQQGMTSLANSVDLLTEGVDRPVERGDILAEVEASWKAVADPVALTTLTLLLLSWLLLFLIVTESVEARGAEIALAKLRGHGRGGILIVGLAEPAVVLLAALPGGLLVGWAAAAGLARTLLLPGTPTDLPSTAWVAAAAAIAGGLVAVILTAQRALRRGVVEQFRRPALLTAVRGWVIDSILITGCAAGLIEVLSLHGTGAAQSSTLILLVPGLLGLAVAVAASRLLPLGCRALYDTASRHGCWPPTLRCGTSLAAARCQDHHRAGHRVLPGRVRLRCVVGRPAQLPARGERRDWRACGADRRWSRLARPSGRLSTRTIRPVGLPRPSTPTRAPQASRSRALRPDRVVARGGYLRSRSQRHADPPAAPPIVLSGDAFRVTVDVQLDVDPGRAAVREHDDRRLAGAPRGAACARADDIHRVADRLPVRTAEPDADTGRAGTDRTVTLPGRSSWQADYRCDRHQEPRPVGPGGVFASSALQVCGWTRPLARAGRPSSPPALAG